MTDEMREERRKQDDEHTEPDTSFEPAKAGEPSEFERFEKLARKLINVSKGEFDEKCKDRVLALPGQLGVCEATPRRARRSTRKRP